MLVFGFSPFPQKELLSLMALPNGYDRVELDLVERGGGWSMRFFSRIQVSQEALGRPAYLWAQLLISQ